MGRKQQGLGLLGRAATGFLNIGVAGAAAVGAAALHSWPILAVGGVTYGALVAWDFVRKLGRDEPSASEAPTLRKVEEYADAQTQASVRAILLAKREIDRVLAETPADVKGNLVGATTSVDALLERAAALAERAEDLSSYLALKDARVVEGEATSLRQRIAQTVDSEARAQYRAALASREDHLRALRDLRNARERVIASLLSIASCLDGLPAKVVHMRALDADAMDRLGGDVNGELQSVNDEMKSFEETLRVLGEDGVGERGKRRAGDVSDETRNG